VRVARLQTTKSRKRLQRSGASFDPDPESRTTYEYEKRTVMCNPTRSTTELGLTDKNHVCSCGTDEHTNAPSEAVEAGVDGTMREHYLVNGMTCSHCVASVTEELSAVDGVESVSVDLKVGGASRIMLVSSKPVAVDDVRAAVSEAGYSLVTI
jgi:copper chaperone